MLINEHGFSKYWPIVNLGEVVEFLDSKRKPITEKDRVSGIYPYYGANGQQDSINDYIFDEPLILLAEDGGHFGNPNKTIAYQVTGKCWVNNHAHVLRPKNHINIRYLCRVLEHYDITKYITGTTRGKLTKTAANQIKIPLPPLEEQKRIAAILDKADEIRQKRKRAIALTEELLKSTFLDMFGDPMINPKGWEVVKIGNIAEVKTGKTPSREKPENYGGTIRWVKTTEVKGNIIYDTEEKLTEKGASQMTIFPKDSIIVAMYGQGITRGRSAILAVSCTTNQACAIILPNYQKYIPVYLWTFLQLCYQQLRDLGRGSNQPNLNLNMIKNFKITLPPLELQNKFYKFVNYTTNLKQKYIDASIESENLFNSLLQKAFKGEL